MSQFEPREPGHRPVFDADRGFPPAEFGIRARVFRYQGAATVLVAGEGFTPNGRVVIHYMHIPYRPVNVEKAGTPMVNDFGEIYGFDRNGRHYPWDESQLFQIVHGDLWDAQTDIFVMARDEATGFFCAANIPGGGAAFVEL
jgi:hypothetical protein